MERRYPKAAEELHKEMHELRGRIGSRRSGTVAASRKRRIGAKRV